MTRIKQSVMVALMSGLIGVSVGLVTVIFGEGLLLVSDVRNTYFLWLIAFLAPVGMLFTFIWQKYGGESTQGMNLVFQAGHGERDNIPKRLVPFAIVGTWLTHLFGGSAGREGVAIQIGATLGNTMTRKVGLLQKQDWLIVGMAAGFAGLFQTPITAIFFALEVLVVGRLQMHVLLPAALAAFSADFVAKHLGLSHSVFPLVNQVTWSPLLLGQLVLLAVACSFVGRLFARGLHWMKALWIHWFENPVIRIGVGGVLVSVLIFLCWQGRYAGLGTNLIDFSFTYGEIYVYDWLLKLSLTILTLSVGFQGGEVTPLFAIGASFGLAAGQLLGMPLVFAAAIGYIAVFASATNTRLAPTFIGCEVFGWQYFPYYFIAVLIATYFNQTHSIYSLQKKAHN